MRLMRRAGVLGRAVTCGWLVTAVIGCGGGSGKSDGGGSGPVTGTGPQQCQQLVTALCTRDDKCNGGGDGGAAALMSCKDSLSVQIGCDRATSTAFQDCVNDVQNLSCGALFPQGNINAPASCSAPTNIPLSDAQNKCFDLVDVVCNHSFMCNSPGVTPSAADLASCEDFFVSDPQKIPCQIAIGVGPSYAQCKQDLQAVPCPPSADGGADGAAAGSADGGMMGGLPSCQGVIMYVQ